MKSAHHYAVWNSTLWDYIRLSTTHSNLHMLHNLTIFQFDDLVPKMEVPVVVSNDNDQFTTLTQVREQCLVKDFLILWILVCRPLIEHIDRAIFQISRHK